MSRDRLYLAHIREAIDRIERYTSGGRDAFMAAPMVQDAVVRNFEIIGEATKRLSAEVKARQPQVPWREVARFRDILIHDYERVDYLEVWNIVQNHLPELHRAVEALLGH
jgi:uncharacterized protein with HEPN domain